GPTEWRVIKARRLIEGTKAERRESIIQQAKIEARELKPVEADAAAKLPDGYLSARQAHKKAIVKEKRYLLLDEIDSLWRDLTAEFERALPAADPTWFVGKAEAIMKRINK